MRTGAASRPSTRGEETRRALVDAAVEILRHEGFASATAREIASRAGCNQALVFYHFGSVVNLLLAALDEVSSQRWERFGQALQRAGGPVEIVDLAARVFEEDLDSGDAALLVEMIAGASSAPGLGPEIKARVSPWTSFARAAVDSILSASPAADAFDAGEIAHALVALYLGLELLSHLDGDRSAATALFERGRRLAPLVALLTEPSPPTKTGPSRKAKT